MPETLLHRCRAAYHPCPRGGWKNLLYWQLRLLGWKAAGLEAFAALALYSVGRALGLWEAAWSLRNALFGLTALAMCTALLGLPFLCRASQYRMLELERATHAGIGTPLVLRFLLLLAGEVVLLAVLAISVYAAAPLKLGQLVCLLAVPFLLANNELLLLVRRVRPKRLVLAAVPLFAGQLCLLRLIEADADIAAAFGLFQIFRADRAADERSSRVCDAVARHVAQTLGGHGKRVGGNGGQSRP